MKECWQIVFISYAVLVVLYTWLKKAKCRNELQFVPVDDNICFVGLLYTHTTVIPELRVVKTVCHSCYSMLSLHGEPLHNETNSSTSKNTLNGEFFRHMLVYYQSPEDLLETSAMLTDIHIETEAAPYIILSVCYLPHQASKITG